jgi:chorismate lyase/3-hydroxybenzoate synthase
MSRGGRPLELARLPLHRLARKSGVWLERVLGGICFGAPPDLFPDRGICVTSVAAPVLSGHPGFCELWSTGESLETGQYKHIRFRVGESLLFGYLKRSETGLGMPPSLGPSALQDAAEAAYLEIFGCLAVLGFSAVARFWNYLPSINLATHGMERYRQFNVGRQNAFLARGRSIVDRVPPACALGCSEQDGLSVAFLATNREVTSIANPRQVEAFHYPRRYGPRSPTFSRAGLLELYGQKSLFVSGTSSIVGHETLHRGDVAAQTRETLANIEAVVAAANKAVGGHLFRMEEMRYNAYIRHAADLVPVRSTLESGIGSGAQVAYIRADICRSDLLVEIEAFGGHINEC